MKKLFLFCVLTTLCLSFPLAVYAEKFDMRDVTCEDIDDEDVLLMIVSWMDGYRSAKTGAMVVDSKTLEKDLDAIGEACKAKPDQKIIDLYKAADGQGDMEKTHKQRLKFEDCDKSNKGFLTFEEAQACWPNLDRKTFDALDTNKDGKLTKEKLKANRERYGKKGQQKE